MQSYTQFIPLLQYLQHYGTLWTSVQSAADIRRQPRLCWWSWWTTLGLTDYNHVEPSLFLHSRGREPAEAWKVQTAEIQLEVVAFKLVYYVAIFHTLGSTFYSCKQQTKLTTRPHSSTLYVRVEERFPTNFQASNWGYHMLNFQGVKQLLLCQFSVSSNTDVSDNGNAASTHHWQLPLAHVLLILLSTGVYSLSHQ